MHKLSLTIKILFFVLLLNLPITSLAKPDDMSDTIIAIVNKDVITMKDFREFLSAAYVQLRSEGLPENEIQETMAEYEKTGVLKLIEQKLMVDASYKKELTIRPKAVDDKMDEIKKSYPTEKDFLDAIVKEGLTVTELRKRIENELRVKYIVELEIKKKVFVNPNEITEYYQKNAGNFQKPERVDLDSIFISYSNTDQKAAEKKANEAIKLVKSGQEFNEVAKNYSVSPSIGMVSKGQMLPAIENTVFNLKEGDISNPVKTDTGIFIFKLKKRYPPETATLDEARDDISNLLYRQKFQQRLAVWLDDLKKKAYVEIKN